jgi:hypothetical protein
MPIHKIQKRNGAIVDFLPDKIEHAVSKAARAAGIEGESIPALITKEVVLDLEDKYDGAIPTVEQAQDADR